MRRPFTREACAKNGVSLAQLRWKLHTGEWQRVEAGVYLIGGEPPTPIERALATVVRTGGVASHGLAGLLFDFDSVGLSSPYATHYRRPRKCPAGLRIQDLPYDAITEVRGYRCTTALRTLVDLAAEVNDITWEHVLENALRDQLLFIEHLEEALPSLGASRVPGVARIRRVLSIRPHGAPPTESLLETLMVQLIRTSPQLPTPRRQMEICNKYGDFVARVDLAWPELGVFIELDGMGHAGQPVYDARRETAVVAAVGWFPGRFTWKEVRHVPTPTLRRLEDIATMARTRFGSTFVS